MMSDDVEPTMHPSEVVRLFLIMVRLISFASGLVRCITRYRVCVAQRVRRVDPLPMTPCKSFAIR